MPYLENLGYSRYTAGFLATMLPLLSFGSRLFTGWISDKITYRTLFILAVSGQLVSIILGFFSSIFIALLLFVILLGLSYGSVHVLRTVALRRYYGSTHLGPILGLAASLGQVGSISGPVFAGWTYDTTGSYDLAWIVSAILLLAGIPLLAALKKPVESIAYGAAV